ncbi:MAG: OB-fold protein [Bacteroidota bacterium]
MKLLRIILILVVIGTAAALYGIREFNRKPESTSEKEAIGRYSAGSLTEQFEKNDSSATLQLAGKIVEVDGIIEERTEDNGTIRIKLKGTDMSSIICQLEAKDSALISGKGTGATVCVKGQCNTYQKVDLLPGGDLLLSNCVLVDYRK